MRELYSLDYNQTHAGLPAAWKYHSRNNPYLFVTKKGMINATQIIRKHQVRSVLDYGCGYGNSLNHISGIKITRWDPFVTEFAARPGESSDLVIAYNVLNAIEREFFDNVMADIYDHCNGIFVANIMCGSGPRWYVNKLLPIIKDRWILLDINVVDIKDWLRITRRNPRNSLSFSSAVLYLEMSKIHKYQPMHGDSYE